MRRTRPRGSRNEDAFDDGEVDTLVYDLDRVQATVYSLEERDSLTVAAKLADSRSKQQPVG